MWFSSLVAALLPISPNDKVFINCDIVAETEKAVRVRYLGIAVWLPKSRIKITKKGIFIPEWLHDEVFK